MTSIKDLVLENLKLIGKWSTAKDVYTFMNKRKIHIGGKTPIASVSSYLVKYAQDGMLIYRRVEKGAGLYGLPEWDTDKPKTPVKDDENVKESFKERSLHQLLCNYLWNKTEYARTIFQERSIKTDTSQKWVHPDVVGVSFVNMSNATAEELLKTTKANEVMRISSYEIKIKLKNDYELKQAYFQALSNSNWANYGYLVAFDISEDNDLIDEMERLNQSFGIGIIKLGVTPKKTRILFPAKKKELDFRTIDKLCGINKEFSEFIEKATNVITAEKKYIKGVKIDLREICDSIIFDDSEIEAYCNKNNIPFEKE